MLSAYNLLARKYKKISRKDIIKDSGIDESTVSRIIQDRYLLETKINEVNQISQKGAN